MKKILIILSIVLLLTTTYAFSMEHKSVSYLTQALKFDIIMEPGEVKLFSLVIPVTTELLKWEMVHEGVVYDYELRGNSKIYTWTFDQPIEKRKSLTAFVQFNREGDANIIAYYSNGREEIVERRIVVLDKNLCGDGRCDEGEEITCPQDCKKFELPRIPNWLKWVMVIGVIGVIVFAIIRIKYWYV